MSQGQNTDNPLQGFLTTGELNGRNIEYYRDVLNSLPGIKLFSPISDLIHKTFRENPEKTKFLVEFLSRAISVGDELTRVIALTELIKMRYKDYVKQSGSGEKIAKAIRKYGKIGKGTNIYFMSRHLSFMNPNKLSVEDQTFENNTRMQVAFKDILRVNMKKTELYGKLEGFSAHTDLINMTNEIDGFATLTQIFMGLDYEDVKKSIENKFYMSDQTLELYENYFQNNPVIYVVENLMFFSSTSLIPVAVHLLRESIENKKENDRGGDQTQSGLDIVNKPVKYIGLGDVITVKQYNLPSEKALAIAALFLAHVAMNATSVSSAVIEFKPGTVEDIFTVTQTLPTKLDFLAYPMWMAHIFYFRFRVAPLPRRRYDSEIQKKYKKDYEEIEREFKMFIESNGKEYISFVTKKADEVDVKMKGLLKALTDQLKQANDAISNNTDIPASMKTMMKSLEKLNEIRGQHKDVVKLLGYSGDLRATSGMIAVKKALDRIDKELVDTKKKIEGVTNKMVVILESMGGGSYMSTKEFEYLDWSDEEDEEDVGSENDGLKELWGLLAKASREVEDVDLSTTEFYDTVSSQFDLSPFPAKETLSEIYSKRKTKLGRVMEVIVASFFDIRVNYAVENVTKDYLEGGLSSTVAAVEEPILVATPGTINMENKSAFLLVMPPQKSDDIMKIHGSNLKNSIPLREINARMNRSITRVKIFKEAMESAYALQYGMSLSYTFYNEIFIRIRDGNFEGLDEISLLNLRSLSDDEDIITATELPPGIVTGAYEDRDSKDIVVTRFVWSPYTFRTVNGSVITPKIERAKSVAVYKSTKKATRTTFDYDGLDPSIFPKQEKEGFGYGFELDDYEPDDDVIFTGRKNNSIFEVVMPVVKQEKVDGAPVTVKEESKKRNVDQIGTSQPPRKIKQDESGDTINIMKRINVGHITERLAKLMKEKDLLL